VVAHRSGKIIKKTSVFLKDKKISYKMVYLAFYVFFFISNDLSEIRLGYA